MIGRLVILVAIVAGLLWLLHWFRRTPPHRVASVLRRSAFYGTIALAVLLAASGRLNPLFAALAAAIPFVIRAVNLLRVLPAIQQVLRLLGIGGIPGTTAAGKTGASGQTSSIRTRFLEMTLDHASGRMDGLVLEGPFQGRRLAELELAPLRALLADCRAHDAQSATLLEAYLDRTHGDTWREDDTPAGGHAAATSEAPMTQDEALAVLGLKPGANPDQIRDAHRRLMQRFHPDRGGSDYLAAKINEAKRLLLGD